MIHTFLASFLPESRANLYLKNILEGIIKLTGSEYGFLKLGDKVEFYSEKTLDECRLSGMMERLWERVGREGAIVLNEPVEGKEGHVPIRRMMLVPIMENGEVAFFVGVANKESDYTEDDLKTVRVLLTTLYNYTVMIDQIFKKLVDSTGTGILVIDENRKIVFANDQIRKIFGVNPENAIGRDFTEFVLRKDRDRLAEYHRLQHKDPNLVAKSFELTLITTDRKRVDVLVTTDLIPQTKLSIVSLIDITELREKSRKLERALRRLEVLHEVDMDILKGKSLKEVLETATKNLRKVVNVESASIMVYNEFTDSFDVTFIEADKPMECSKLSSASIRSFDLLKDGKIVKIDSINPHELTEHEAMMVEHGIESYVLSPLIVRNKLVGILCLASKEYNAFTDVIDFVREISSQLAITINELKLQEMKKEAFRQIEHNIEQFAILVDHIRNPVAAAQGFTEVYIEDEVVRDKIKAQLDRIIDLVKKLESGWVKSENIREFLRRW